MTSVDFKQRLYSLKNMTEDLKNSTQVPSINISHLKTLIGNLKELSAQPSLDYSEESRLSSLEQSSPSNE